MATSAGRGTFGTALRVKARRAVQDSPAPVRDVLLSASNKIVRALTPPSAPVAPAAPERFVVWQTPEVPTPDGMTVADVEKILRTWSINGEPVGHMDAYVSDSLMRFLYTWSLVRSESGTALELGGNPYFTTYLLEQHTDLELTLANYYGARGSTTETVSYLPAGASERREVSYDSALFNVEEDEFPYETDSLDVVLFCEMLEHMLMDPTATLREISRILKPGGLLVLTTPNVARIINVLSLVNGANMYDPYSGYGPYGRHNREYTRHELHRLLEFMGFDVEASFTADGHPVDALSWPKYDEVAPLVEYRRADLGHYLFIKARRVREPREGLPSFLFRSWPEGKIVD